MVYLTSVTKVMKTATGGIPYFSNKGTEMNKETGGIAYFSNKGTEMNKETGGIPHFSNKGTETNTATSGFDRANKNDNKNTYPGSSNPRNTFLSHHSLRSRWALRYNISSHHVKVPSKLYLMIIIRYGHIMLRFQANFT